MAIRKIIKGILLSFFGVVITLFGGPVGFTLLSDCIDGFKKGIYLKASITVLSSAFIIIAVIFYWVIGIRWMLKNNSVISSNKLDNSSSKYDNLFVVQYFPNLCWSIAFCILGISSYGATGKAGDAYLLVLGIMSFPSSVIFASFDLGNISLSLTPILILAIIGYLQWFVVVPYLIRIVLEIKNKNNNGPDIN